MKRFTWIILVAIVSIFLVIFTIWQLSIVITPGHVLFFVVMGLILALFYWLFERSDKTMTGAQKTRIAIMNCKRWWKDEFNEDLTLTDGQFKTTKFQDYGDDLFKSFVFQVSSGARRGHFIKITYSFIDNDIFEVNDSPSVQELVDPLEGLLPNRLGSPAIWDRDRPQRMPRAVAMPVMPMQQQQSETDFEERKENKEDEKPPVRLIKKRYY